MKNLPAKRSNGIMEIHATLDPNIRFLIPENLLNTQQSNQSSLIKTK